METTTKHRNLERMWSKSTQRIRSINKDKAIESIQMEKQRKNYRMSIILVIVIIEWVKL